MKLVPLLTFRNALSSIQDIGMTPFGQRTTYIIGEGRFEGQRLKGRVVPGGGDWLLRGEDGLAELDVRKTFETDDGALIHVSYTGLYRFSEEVTAKLGRGEDCGFGETLFKTHVRFQTGDTRYAWLNAVIAVGEGRETREGVEYRIFSLDDG